MGDIQRSGTAALAALLTRAREDAALTRRELAERTGLSYPYISQLETGYRGPSAEAMQRLTEALGVPVEAMVTAMAERDTPHPRTNKPNPRTGTAQRPPAQPSAYKKQSMVGQSGWAPVRPAAFAPVPRPPTIGPRTPSDLSTPRPAPCSSGSTARRPPPGRIRTDRRAGDIGHPRARRPGRGATSPARYGRPWWPRSSPDSANCRPGSGWPPSTEIQNHRGAYGCRRCGWPVRRIGPKPEPLGGRTRCAATSTELVHRATRPADPAGGSGERRRWTRAEPGSGGLLRSGKLITFPGVCRHAFEVGSLDGSMAATGCENLAPSASPSPAQAGTSPIGCVLPCLPLCPLDFHRARERRGFRRSRLDCRARRSALRRPRPAAPPCCARRPISASTPPPPSRAGPSRPCSTATTSPVLRRPEPARPPPSGCRCWPPSTRPSAASRRWCWRRPANSPSRSPTR